MQALGVVKALLRRPDPELAKGETPVHGKGGNLDHEVIKVKSLLFMREIRVKFPIHTMHGTVMARPGQWLISDRRGCRVIDPPPMVTSE